MGLVSALMRPLELRAEPPHSDFWYKDQPYGMLAASGVQVTQDAALTLSVVWACNKVLSEDISSVPLPTYQRYDDGSRDVAYDYPLYPVLHDRPNEFQTAMEWREMSQSHVDMRGNAYSLILPGPRGRVDQLIPIHPDHVRVVYKADWSRVYYVRNGSEWEPKYPDEIFHLRGLSLDGKQGVSVVTYARESFGLALAEEQWAARYYSEDATPSVVLKHPKTLSKQAATRISEDFQVMHAGLRNKRRPAVLEEGMDLSTISLSPKDSEWIAGVQHSVEDGCRWFRMQPHKIQHLLRSTFNNIEHQSIEHVVDTVRPWAVRWDQALGRLIPEAERGRFYVEHNLEGLLRGDSKARAEYYNLGITGGWLVRNEARAKENLNRLQGLDEPLMPLNMAVVGADGRPVAPAEPAGPPPAGPEARARELAQEGAVRVVRKEQAAVTRAAARSATDAEAFAGWVDEWYAEHGMFVRQTLSLRGAASMAAVERYLARHRDELKAFGVAAVETWEERDVPWLAELAANPQEDAA